MPAAEMVDIERIDSGTGRRALLNVASLRRLEVAALASVPPYTLMTRAGDAVARLALAVAPHAHHIVVFAGPGHNGGDGLEAASRLQALGKRVSAVLVADPAKLPADAAQALARARASGVALLEIEQLGTVDSGGAAAAGIDVDLVVDALLGLGANRAPEGAIGTAVERIAVLAARGAHVLAVDLPTGLDGERGSTAGRTVVADDTLCLLALQPGLFTAAGRDHAGRIWRAPLVPHGIGIGVGTDIDAGAAADAWLVGTGDATCAAVPRRHGQHKGSFGDVVVIGGAPGMAGAALLAARAAHAAGAGRVHVDRLGDVDGSGSAHDDLDPLRPELMLRHGVATTDARLLASATVVCGCGGGEAVRAVLPRLLSMAGRLVLDADALNAVATDAALQTLLAARRGRDHATVLTPHPLEAARLLGIDTRVVQADRLAAARQLVERYGAVVVLKGSGTVIAAPTETPRLSVTGNASLASAGTGDVLAGWLGGRWASSGASAFDVATRAVVEHGAAAEPERPGALRAGDLIERLHRRSRA